MDFSFLLDPNLIAILLKGMLMTIVLSLFSVLIGSILGVIPALGRLSNNKFVYYISTFYVDIIRGTPLLVQVLLIYAFINLPVTIFLGIDLSNFIPGMLALIINSSAYVAELIRGGIESVDKGQTEAALSLGMTKSQTMKKIVFPQAIKNIIPSLGNEFVTMIKETAIFINVGVAELMYSAEIVKTYTYAIKETYIVVAILYLLLTIPMSKFMSYLEKRLSRNER
ncbi:MAG TPA: amino acid ABC transporter permease [Acholeplasmataceae bacterium]|nr:amino acid ABC transporter permease [Acholeplasmataceae bacterium]